MTRGFILCAGLFAACQANSGVPLPAVPEGTRALLLLTGSAETIDAVWALELGAGGGDNFEYRAGDQLHALAYRCGLDRLGPVPGKQALLGESAASARVPLPTAAFSSSDDGAHWQAADGGAPAIEQALGRLPLDNENACKANGALFVPRPISFEGIEREAPAFALQVAPDRALLGDRVGRIFTVDEQAQILEMEPAGPHRWGAAYRAPDGELWLLAYDGTLARGPMGGPYLTVTSSNPLGRPPTGETEYLALAGPTDGSPFELFAAARAGADNAKLRSFARFDGTRWQLLGSHVHGDLYLPAVAWIAPGEAMAIGMGQLPSTVLRYKNGEVSEELLPGTSGPASIVHLPGVGSFVGRDNGGIDQRQSDGLWRSISVGRSGIQFVRVIGPAGQGLIFGASTETNFIGYRFGQVQPDVGPCPFEALTDVAAVYLSRFDDGSLLVATEASFSAPMGAYVLAMEREPQGCSGAQ